MILEIGGVRTLRALGYDNIVRFYMNEGHASLLTWEVLDEEARKADRHTITHDNIAAVRQRCVFTIHAGACRVSPVPPLVDRVLGRREVFDMKEVFCCEGRLNMAYLALNLSYYVNGVAKNTGMGHGTCLLTMSSIPSRTGACHRAQWFILQYASHDAAVRAEDILLTEGGKSRMQETDRLLLLLLNRLQIVDELPDPPTHHILLQGGTV